VRLNNTVNKLLLILMLSLPATAATKYISTLGSNSNGGTSCNDAYLTFAKIQANTSGGDTWKLCDGGITVTYSVAAGTGIIDCAATANVLSGCPPSGSVGNYTLVQAQHCGGYVYITSSDAAYSSTNLRLSTAAAARNYVHLDCLEFHKGQDQIVNGDHIWISNCGFGSQSNSVSAVFGFGSTTTSVTNFLVQDSWFWGSERAMITTYRSNTGVWRRIALFQGGCNGDGTGSACNSGGNSLLVSTVYNSDHISLQNMLSIDATRGTNGRNGAADFQTAFHNNFPANAGLNEWLGTLSINSKLDLALMEADSPTGAGTDYAPFWKVENMGLFTNDNSTQAGFSALINGTPSANETYDFQKITVYRGADNTLDLFGINSGMSGKKTALGDINTYGVGRYGLSSPDQADCVNTYGAAHNYNLTTPTNHTETNPSGTLLYPPVFPTGSFLDAACGKKGADNRFRYGVNDSFYGDANFDTITATSVWPWPNEGEINTSVCADLPTTPYCLSGYTLTTYVYSYMGNPPSPSCAITAPANGATVSGASVTISGTATNGAVGGTLNTQVNINGSSLGTVVTGGSWTKSWDTTTGAYPDGGYTISATTVDDAQVVANCSGSVNVTVHNAAADTSVKFVGAKVTGGKIK